MPYYPKSQIKTGLYARRGQYIIQSTQQDYIGPFYEISSGKKFTGKYPGDGENSELIFNPDNYDAVSSNVILPEVPPSITVKNIINSYSELTPLNYPITPSRSIPHYKSTLPTPQDYTTGIFTRYFAKKNNEPKFIEINLDQYNKFLKKDPTVALDLYSVGKILWKIKGTSNQVYETNKKNTELFENQNKWWGFSQYFKDNFTRYLK